MRDLQVTANKFGSLVFPRARRARGTAILFLIIAVLSLDGSIQAQDTSPTPLDRDTLVAAADQARTEERFSDAVRLYSRAEKAFGPHAEVFRGRAMAREMLNEDRKAVEDYKKALKIDATDYESLERMAGIYERGVPASRKQFCCINGPWIWIRDRNPKTISRYGSPCWRVAFGLKMLRR